MNTVTLGGLCVGISVLIGIGVRWWFHEAHRPAAAVPYLLSIAYGMIGIISTGGLLSGVFGIALWGASGLGDLALVFGVGGSTADTTRAQQVALTSGGYVTVLLLTVTVICLVRWASAVPVRKVIAGSLGGACLGLSGTVAGAAAVPLASAVNALGAAVTMAIQ
ncbi:hypothetical protein ACWGB8_17290 [Kitasatospora sp. NPDC054939]